MYPTETCLFVFNYYHCHLIQALPYVLIVALITSIHTQTYRNDIYVLFPVQFIIVVQLCDCSVIGYIKSYTYSNPDAELVLLSYRANTLLNGLHPLNMLSQHFY